MERNRNLDIIKGICILAIVFGHAGIKFLWFNYVSLYGFYFISGYLYKRKTFKDFALSKLSRLYIPFVFNCYFSLLILYVLSVVSKGFYQFDKKMISYRILLFDIPSSYMAPAWFIFPLFVISLLFFFLNKVIKNEYILLMFSFVLYVFALLFKNRLTEYQWANCAWLINVFVGIFAFTCGYFVKRKKNVEKILLQGPYSFTILLASITVLSIIVKFFNYPLNLREGVIENNVLNTLVIIFGIIFLLIFANIINKVEAVAKILSLVGKYSMEIMYFHILSFSIVTLSIHYICGYPYPEIDWTHAYAVGWLRLVNGVVGIAIPLLASWGISKGKKR